MPLYDFASVEGRLFPARRRTSNLVNGSSPIASGAFSMGIVALEPLGGQVPWHDHIQEEIYVILEGAGEVCVGDARHAVRAGMTVQVPPNVFHQLTNTSDAPMRMLYCYAPVGEVAHWRQELDGTLPVAGQGATPPLPAGAWPQHTDVSPSPARIPDGWTPPGE